MTYVSMIENVVRGATRDNLAALDRLRALRVTDCDNVTWVVDFATLDEYSPGGEGIKALVRQQGEASGTWLRFRDGEWVSVGAYGVPREVRDELTKAACGE